ncbi:MAG: transporter substrate-binding domain-containing protein, partial [Victivallales bacterium]|nr:transporter substrate-binding domain-containing protein [Victivallales bacterium]
MRKTVHMGWIGIVAGLLLFSVTGRCGVSDQSPAPAAPAEEFQDLLEPQVSLPPLTPRDRGEAAPRTVREIRRSGVLRVLMVEREMLPHLPRRESIRDRELALLTLLADWLNVRIQLICTADEEAMITALNAGKGDLAAIGVAVTPEKLRRLAFSRPLTQVHEQLVAGVAVRIRNLDEMKGKTVVVEAGTPYWQRLNELRQHYPEIKMLSRRDDTETLLALTAAGKIAFTVTDDLHLQDYLAYRRDVRAVYTFPGVRYLAWGMSRRATGLREVVNLFLAQYLPVVDRGDGVGDLAQMRARRIIRVIT